MICAVALTTAGVAIGLSLWTLKIATQTRDLTNLMFTRGRFTPLSSDTDEGTP